MLPLAYNLIPDSDVKYEKKTVGNFEISIDE